MSGRTRRGQGEAHERHYRLVHRTAYTYTEPVTSSYGLAMLLPREGHGQRVHHTEIAITPTPAELAEHLDLHGNRSTYFHVTQEHTALEVVATSLLTITRRPLDPATVPQVPWEQGVAAVSGMRATGKGGQGEGPASVLAVVESALPSELVDVADEVREYAMPSFGPGTSLVHVIADLSRRIRQDFAYQPGRAAVYTPLPEVLARRAGAYRDLTHLLIGGLRSMGLAARYVSGYVDAAPAGDGEQLRGTDAAHAWASVWVPGGGWLHVDPTNDRFIDNRYVVLGWGRDLRDVSPLRGIGFTSGPGSSPSVDVDLAPLTEQEMQALRRPVEQASERRPVEQASERRPVDRAPGRRP